MNCITIEKDNEELIVESDKGIKLKQWRYKRVSINDNFYLDYADHQLKIICNEQEYKIPLYNSLIINNYVIFNGQKHIIIYLF